MSRKVTGLKMPLVRYRSTFMVVVMMCRADRKKELFRLESGFTRVVPTLPMSLGLILL